MGVGLVNKMETFPLSLRLCMWVTVCIPPTFAHLRLHSIHPLASPFILGSSFIHSSLAPLFAITATSIQTDRSTVSSSSSNSLAASEMSAGDESPSRYDKLELSSVRNTFHSIRRYGLPTIEEKPKLYRPSPGAWMVTAEEGEGEEGEECGANSSDQRSSTLSSARSSPSSHCHRPKFVNSSPPMRTTNAADGMAMAKTGGNPSETASFNMTTTKSKKCARCDRTVFQAEQVVAAGDRWHKSCFRCLLCGKSLELGKFCDKSGEIYCNKCYAREYGPKGIGCGGVLQMHQ